MMNEIIVSDECSKIKEEIVRLRAKVANLLQEVTELVEHICPELEARYTIAVGDRLNRILGQRLMVEELKRKISILQAALNRREKVSRQTVNEQVEEEYKEYREKVNEQFEEAQRKKEEQEKKEKQKKEYEEQFNEREENKGKRSNDSSDEEDNKDEETDGTDSDNSRDGDAENTEDTPKDDFEGMSFKQKLKELYRRIVKKLHPDMNPNISEHEKDLWNKAQEAYREGDIETLERIYDEINEVKTEDIPDDEEGLEKLIKLRDHLVMQKKALQKEIREIKSRFPYTEKEFLDDDVAVKAKQDELDEIILELERVIDELAERIEELNAKINGKDDLDAQPDEESEEFDEKEKRESFTDFFESEKETSDDDFWE